MPALVMYGRRLGFGSDELAVPSLCGLAIRLLWSVSLAVMLIQAIAWGALVECTDAALVYTYLTASLVSLLLSILTERRIFTLSSQGSITDTRPREKIGLYITCHFALGVVQVGLAITGIYLLTELDPSCSDSDRTLQVLVGLVSASQLVDVTVVLCCFALLPGVANPNLMEGTHYERYPLEDIERQWSNRCEIFCRLAACCTCNLFGGVGATAEHYRHLARVLARIFHTEEYLDLVASDIAAGIVLLRHKQRRQQRLREMAAGDSPANHTAWQHDHEVADDADVELGSQTLTSQQAGVQGRLNLPLWAESRRSDHERIVRLSGRKVLDVDAPNELVLLEEVTYYARYTLAIYTWYLYMLDNPICGPCKLCFFGCLGLGSSKQRNRRCRVRGSSGSVDVPDEVCVTGDNCCRTNETALMRVAGLMDCQLVHAHFLNDVVATPYALLVDHAKQALVLTIRGTMSLDDCIADALAEPVHMKESGERWGFDGDGMWAHRGAAERAEWLMQDMEAKGILAWLVQQSEAAHGSAADAAMDTPLSRGRQGYALRVCGHSMGGTIAVLVACMLQRIRPETRCICISPPGGSMDADHAKRCKRFVISAVVDRDIVPRLSVQSIEGMRDAVLDLLGQSNVSKLTVMRSLLHDSYDGVVQGDANQVPHFVGDFQEQLGRYRTLVSQRKEERPLIRLCPPGHIIHFVQTARVRRKACTGRRRIYTPVWATPSDFDDVKVSPTMFVDHFVHLTVPMLERTLHEVHS
ncbi:unnamed protein product, partial [Chrysoparadoxa australica]